MDKCGVDIRMDTICKLKENTSIINHMDTTQNKMFSKKPVAEYIEILVTCIEF